MYDISNEYTFINIRNYMKQIEANAQTNLVKVLVGNNCEKPDRKVTENQGKDLANEFGFAFFETSPKTNQNVNEVFNFLTEEILRTNDGKNQASLKKSDTKEGKKRILQIKKIFD